MTVIEGVDYSVGRPDPACLFAAGKRFASRYLSSPGGIDKDLSRAEAEALTAAGVAIVCNWEDWEEKPLRGHDTGVADATAARDQAKACGMPDDRPIYFSVDFDVSTAQLEQSVGPYFQGCIDVLGVKRVGAYGGLRCISWLFDHHLITWGWQTYAWSHGVWDGRAQVQQYNNSEVVCGVSLDLDRAVFDDYGQWFTGGTEEDLASSDEILAAVANVQTAVDAMRADNERFQDREAVFRENEQKRFRALMTQVNAMTDAAEMKKALQAFQEAL